MVALPTLLAGTGGSGLLGGLFGGSRKRGFRKVLKHSDFTTSDVTCTSATSFNLIGSYTVPAQQEIAVGYGNAQEPMNQGYLYLQAKDTGGTEFEGYWRISVANANTTAIDVVFEEYSTRTDGDTADKSKMLALPEITNYPVLGRVPREDDTIRVEFKPDTASKVMDYGNSSIFIPVTVYQ